ncbi:MAG: hypothetical protein ACK5WF_21960 [Cyclobacteriaceae bacterium]
MKLFLPSLFFILNITLSYSQGCSDAGFCTMGAMKPDQPYNKKIQLKLRSMEVSFYRGTTTLAWALTMLLQAYPLLTEKG